MLNRNNLAPGIAEKLKKRIQELIGKSGRSLNYDEEAGRAADDLSLVSVKESEQGKFSAKSGQLPGNDDMKAVTGRTARKRKT